MPVVTPAVDSTPTSSFSLLPQEIINLIIYFATRPIYNLDDSEKRSYYGIALKFCFVSHSFRCEAMRHLLRSVVLLCTSDVRRFCATLHLQQQHKENLSPLALDYSLLVRQLWCSRCEWEMFEHGMHNVDYTILYNIVAGLDCLGIQFHALPLLYNTLSLSSRTTSIPWTCFKVIFCGNHWRWNPLQISGDGLNFLSQVTHFQCWLSDLGNDDRFMAWKQQIGNSAPQPRDTRLFQNVPLALQRTPFKLLTSLVHFASCFFEQDAFWTPPASNALVVIPVVDQNPRELILKIKDRSSKRSPSWLATPMRKWHVLFISQAHEVIWGGI